MTPEYMPMLVARMLTSSVSALVGQRKIRILEHDNDSKPMNNISEPKDLYPSKP
jgi:hypothetical protein